jgi:heparanase 1
MFFTCFLRVGFDDHLIDKILNPSYLDGGSQPFRSLQGILKTSGTPAVAWVGEAGGAYNSGHNLVTNAFVFSFW